MSRWRALMVELGWVMIMLAVFAASMIITAWLILTTGDTQGGYLPAIVACLLLAANQERRSRRGR